MVTSRKGVIRKRIIAIGLTVAIMAPLYPNISFAQSAEDQESAESFAPGSLGKVEETNEVKFNQDYLKGYISDTKYILTSPLRWEKSDWLKFSLVAGTTIGLYIYDLDIQNWVQDRRNSTTDSVARIAESSGNGFFALSALGGFYLYGYSLEDKKASKTALLGLESFVISGVFVQAIKLTTQRQRPNEGNQPDKWNGPGFSFQGSFPSSHATVAFALGTVFASEYQNIAWVPPAAYGIASLAAVSRVITNYHWASDVFFGSAIGFFTSKAIVGLHKKNPNIVIMPVIDGQVRGLALSLIF
jgi:membrane-associated phospholipid phosphatase